MNIVEPPCATTSRKRLPIQNPNFLLSQSPVFGTFRKQPPLVSDRHHDHVSGWRFNNFPCKGLFDAVCSFLFRVWEKLLSTTWNYTYCNLETARHKLSSIKKYKTDIFTEATPHGSIPVNDHLLIFAFWVAAYRRFDCNFFFCSIPLNLGASQVWITCLLIYKFQPIISIYLVCATCKAFIHIPLLRLDIILYSAF